MPYRYGKENIPCKGHVKMVFSCLKYDLKSLNVCLKVAGVYNNNSVVATIYFCMHKQLHPGLTGSSGIKICSCTQK